MSVPVEFERALQLAQPVSVVRSASDAPPDTPVVLRGALQSWPASEQWTFDYFKALMGPMRARLETDIIDPRLSQAVEVRFADFIDWIVSRCNPEAIRSGSLGGAWPLSQGLYFTASFAELPPFFTTLLSALDPSSLRLGDLFQELAAPLDLVPFCLPFGNLFIGDEGTRTRAHVDYWGSHAVIAQLQGQKCALLSLPVQGERGRQQRPLYRATLQPGEVLLIPGGWSHEVVSLTPAISASWNYCTVDNLDVYLGGLQSSPEQTAFAAGVLGWSAERLVRELSRALRAAAQRRSVA